MRLYTNVIDPWLTGMIFLCGEWRGKDGRGNLSHNAAACKAPIVMLSATSRIALLSIARNARPRTTILASRSIRACQLATVATTAHRCHTLPLSDAQLKTIYALSTPPGKSGVAIIRVSGPEVLSVWKRMVRTTRGARHGLDKGEKGSSPAPWKLERCHILDPHNTSEILDEALAVFFRGARHQPPQFQV